MGRWIRLSSLGAKASWEMSADQREEMRNPFTVIQFKSRKRWAVLAWVILLLATRHPAFSQDRAPTTPGPVSGPQTLTGHVTKEIKTAPPVGDVPLDQVLYLSIGFPMQNKADLDKEAASLYDPQSPNFHKFLKPNEFGDRYGLPQAEYQKAVDFFKSKGFVVEQVYQSRLLITVKGTAADIQKTFHVHLRNYKRPDGTVFHSPDSEPAIDLAIPILHVSGLNNFDIPKTDIHILKKMSAATPAIPGSAVH